MSLKRKLRRKIKPGKAVTASSVRVGTCPSCKRHVSIVEDKETGEQMLLHKMPFCQYYVDTDSEVFGREIFGPPKGELN